MGYGRDPLSWHYDGYVRQVMIRAIRAGRTGRGVRVYVASPRSSFRSVDAGGRTKHERAFTRSVYYLMWRTPINAGAVPEWSVKMSWGDEVRASSGNRLARPVTIRVWPRSQARVRGESWAKNDELRSGGIGSPWRRADMTAGAPRGEAVRTTSYRQKLARERARNA